MLRSIGVCLVAVGLAMIGTYLATDLSIEQVCVYAFEWMILCGFVLLLLTILFPANDDVQRKLESDILELEDYQIVSSDSAEVGLRYVNDDHSNTLSPYLTLPLRTISEAEKHRRFRKARIYRGDFHAL